MQNGSGDGRAFWLDAIDYPHDDEQRRIQSDPRTILLNRQFYECWERNANSRQVLGGVSADSSNGPDHRPPPHSSGRDHLPSAVTR